MTATAASLKKIAEGREAEMFEWEGDRVLRLYRPGHDHATAAYQARVLGIAGTCGVRVPATYGIVEVDGRQGIVMERLSGTDLLTELGSKPWILFAVGTTWGRLHAEINSKPAPLELPPTRMRYRLAVENSPLIPDEMRAPTLARLDSLPDGDRLNHGDFHPANIMRANGDYAVIDWSNATRGPAEADYARSYMMGTLGEVPPGTPWLIRTFARFGRRVVRGRYDSAYRKVLKPDRAAVEAWRLPVYVSRLAEGIEEERPTLLAEVAKLWR